MSAKKNPPFDLPAFLARRDEAVKHALRWPATSDEVMTAYHQGIRDFTRVRVEDGDFESNQLPSVNFRSALFVDCNFAYTNMRYSDSPHAIFDNCQMESVDLSSSYLPGTYFRGAHLVMADFGMADITDSTFQYANLQNADLRRAHMTGTDFGYANLNRAVGLYSTFGFFVSSRHDILSGSIRYNSALDKFELQFSTGCQDRIDLDQLQRRNEAEHSATRIAAYNRAIDYLMAQFVADVGSGAWEYLKKWQPVVWNENLPT